MVREAAAGGVVYCYSAANQLQVLIILDKYGNWGLPKGHLDDGETEIQAARREIAEETGVICTIGPLIQRIEYPIYKRGERRSKRVDYFLARAECAPLTPRLDEGINEARWVPPDVALTMVRYEQVREVLRRGLAMLAAR